MSEQKKIAPKVLILESGEYLFEEGNSAKFAYILLDGNMEKVTEGSFPKEFFVEGSEWFTVNYKKASDTFRKIYRSYKKYTPNSKRLGVHNYKTFSLENMTKELGVLLDRYVPEFPKQVKLELPKLNKVEGDKVAAKRPPKLELPKLKKV